MKHPVHQIKIDFYVTPEIRRYVYVYLIEGETCCLIDAGVAGAESVIEKYMNSIGRNLSEISAVFLTHAHPDHIGSAARLKELTGCRVYAGEGERPWIEDIDLQFAQRPIPNFYTLAGSSVEVDETVSDGDVITPEPGLTLTVLGTPGHSCDELSYILQEDRCIFTGDAIPVRGDIPIWIDRERNRESLEKLASLEEMEHFYPAWDTAYEKEQAAEKIRDALQLMDQLQEAADRCREKGVPPEEMTAAVCSVLGTPQFLSNPLFARTVRSML